MPSIHSLQYKRSRGGGFQILRLDILWVHKQDITLGIFIRFKTVCVIVDIPASRPWRISFVAKELAASTSMLELATRKQCTIRSTKWERSRMRVSLHFWMGSRFRTCANSNRILCCSCSTVFPMKCLSLLSSASNCSKMLDFAESSSLSKSTRRSISSCEETQNPRQSKQLEEEKRKQELSGSREE